MGFKDHRSGFKGDLFDRPNLTLPHAEMPLDLESVYLHQLFRNYTTITCK
jgi:hypothetical protein